MIRGNGRVAPGKLADLAVLVSNVVHLAIDLRSLRLRLELFDAQLQGVDVRR